MRPKPLRLTTSSKSSRTRIPSSILIISAWSVLSPVRKIAKLLLRKLPRHAVMENSVKQSMTTVNSVRIYLMIIPTSAITLTCWRVVIRKWTTSPSLLSSIIAVKSLLTSSKNVKVAKQLLQLTPLKQMSHKQLSQIQKKIRSLLFNKSWQPTHLTL